MTGPGRLLPGVRVDEMPTPFQERAVVLYVGGWGGAEVRPTRVFLWLGPREAGHEWLLPLAPAGPPRLLRRARRRRYLSLGRGWEVSYLGNPGITLGLVGYRLVKRMVRGPAAGSAPTSVELDSSVARRDA